MDFKKELRAQILIKVGSIFFLLLSSCGTNIDNKCVEDNHWLYDSGFQIGEGDFMRFDLNYSIKGDTIFYKNIPRAKCKSIFRNELKIESLDSKEKGYYINVEEFTR